MAEATSSNRDPNEFRTEPGAILVDEHGEVRGTVRLSLSLLTDMIELTVQDIPGVAGVQGKGKVPSLLPHGSSKDGDKSAPVKQREHGGIKVRVKGNQLDADVTVLATGDVSIPDLGRAIQAKITAAAERMLGMKVGTINVHVADIQLPAGDTN